MIPITRKELYLNKIVGNDDYDIPEKPITEEEFFFAEILGEAVQAPEPLTRYQMYLAKIAGKNIEIPYPETRLEYFLARAAGMDVETPTPITREEIYWSNYTATTEFELEGVPPLIFRSDGSALKNYRFYGATGGVGDYDENSGKYVIPVTIAGKNKFDGTLFSGYYTDSTMTSIGGVSGNYKSCKVYLSAGTYTFSCSVSVLIIRYITSDIYRSNPIGSKYTQEYTFTLANDSYVSLAFRNESNTAWDDSTTIQVELSQSATEYEPFHEPSTINIFLDEPVYEGESVSMADTSIQIGTIDGTNILTVGTAVQPSKVYLKGKIEEIPTRTVSYYSQDGSTLLGTETVESGGNASGLQDTPTKPDTEQYTYTFVGWSNTTNATTAMSGILNNITADKSVYAAFSETEKTFTVTFYNGAELIYTAQNVSYNGTAVYSGTTPTKAETSEYTYTFAGWNTNSSASTADADALTNVTADRTVYAIFTAVSKGYTVYFYNGKTLLEAVTGVPSGGTATYTGATPTKSGYVFTGWSPSPTNIQADTACYARFKEDEMYESITDTWSQIIANVSNGTYSTKYQFGDTKKIDLGTEGEVIMQIVGIDADDLADNSGKAPITWISKQLLKTNHRMNPTKQSGTSGTGALGGWEACEMRSYLINTIKPLLPSEVRNALKTVKKYSRIYNTSGTALNNIVSNDDIWIPSAYEVNLSNYETSGVTYSSAFPENESRIKHTVDGSAALWWLRSAYDTNGFVRVHYNGSGSHVSAASTYGVAVGFVI